jgi:hypothetical protein
VTKQEKERKIKLVMLIIIVLKEKARRTDLIPLLIATAVEIAMWVAELKKIYSIKIN